MNDHGGATLGQFIAARLVEVGCTDYFGVPGEAPELPEHVLCAPFLIETHSRAPMMMLMLAYSHSLEARRRLQHEPDGSAEC